MIDFSQGKEQQVILDYFGDRKGVCLSIGENDGQTFSNVRALILRGFEAVLVEPSPPAFEKLYKLYAVDEDRTNSEANRATMQYANTDGIMIVQAAITTADGPIDLYDSGTHLKKGDVALLSTTVPSEMDRWKRSGEQFTRTTVRGITFATLLKECGLIYSRVCDYTDTIPENVAHFSFISIDAEGADWTIVQQIDLAAVGCEMLCIEFNQKNENQFVDYCAKFGMRLRAKTFENLIFVRT